IDVNSLTDSTGTGSLKAASFSESGGTNATTTLSRPLLTTGAAGVSIADDTTITANSTIDTSGAAGAVTLGAGAIPIKPSCPAATINAGTGTVTLRQTTDVALTVDASAASGHLSLTDAELGQITAGKLILGRNNSGFTKDLTVNSAIGTHAGFSSLALLSGGK